MKFMYLLVADGEALRQCLHGYSHVIVDLIIRPICLSAMKETKKTKGHYKERQKALLKVYPNYS